MRIVITKNGKTIIKDIYPEVKYKKLISYSTRKYQERKSYLDENNNNRTIQNKSFGPNSSFNTTKINNSNIYNSIDIDDVLTDIKDNPQNSQNITNLNITQKFNLPPSITYKYLNENETINKENDNKNLLPNVFDSINKKIEKEANQKGYDYIYDNIASLKSYKKDIGTPQKSKDKNNNEYSISHYKLPSLFPAYPLKYIINNESFKKIKKEINEENEKVKRGEQLTENNFRSRPLFNPKLNFRNSLKKEINTQNANLITYLNISNDLHAPFIKRISKYDEEHLKRLNKISQKTMFNKGQENLIKGIIRRKIKGAYENTNDEIKEGLETIKGKLFDYDKIIKTEEKKVINKKDRYIVLHRETENIWNRYDLERFNKKGNNNEKQNEKTNI